MVRMINKTKVLSTVKTNRENVCYFNRNMFVAAQCLLNNKYFTYEVG